MLDTTPTKGFFIMPNVGNMKFPYTAKGKADAKMAAKKMAKKAVAKKVAAKKKMK